MSSSPHPAQRTIAADDPIQAALPTRAGALVRWAKRGLHAAIRSMRNGLDGPARHPRGDQLADAPVIAEHRSSLWQDGRDDEFILRAGKVQNLRLALKGFDGVEVPAGAVLGFWRQVGWPGRLRGFVEGREIIQGCVVPTPGGGLCQLSNALAEVASQAGFEFVERHRHSARIEQGSLPGEEATVAWNHIDLRLRARFDFRIEVSLSATTMAVRLRARPSPVGAQPVRRVPIEIQAPVVDERRTARGCLTCAETACFRHRPAESARAAGRVLLLDEYAPELAAWLTGAAADTLWLLPWQRPTRRQQGWHATPLANALSTRQQVTEHLAVWRRMLWQRLPLGEGASRQRMRQTAAGWLARAYARRLQPVHVNLLVTQSLLVPLWRDGVLGGRTYDVWLNELPASALQERLDAGAAQESAPGLSDFRVAPDWQADEWRALAGARERVTAHAAIAEALRARGLSCTCLPWQMAAPVSCGSGLPVARAPAPGKRLTLVLPASALPRKGATAVRIAARALDARVLILGSPPSRTAEWEGVEWQAVGYAGNWLAEGDAVVLPAYVEHQPRALLRALAAGRPVFASPACGLGALPGWVAVEPGCAESLLAALRAWQAAGGQTAGGQVANGHG